MVLNLIITVQKPLDEIMKMLEGYDKIVIVGCNTCSALCQTGGEEEIKEIVEKLKDEKQILVVSTYFLIKKEEKK